MQTGVNAGGVGAGNFWMFNAPSEHGISWSVGNAVQMSLDPATSNLGILKDVSITGTLQCVSVMQYTVSANVSAITPAAINTSHKIRFLGPGGEVLWLLATSVAG